MTVSELIKMLQVACHEMPNGLGTEVCLELATDDGENTRVPLDFYIDEEADKVVFG